jgi:hypothetical protein
MAALHQAMNDEVNVSFARCSLSYSVSGNAWWFVCCWCSVGSFPHPEGHGAARR